jgi:hypothetical protein
LGLSGGGADEELQGIEKVRRGGETEEGEGCDRDKGGAVRGRRRGSTGGGDDAPCAIGEPYI